MNGLPSASDLVLYINLGIVALFLIAFLIGYIRGLFKSVFNLASSCLMVFIFFLIFPLISKGLMNMDISWINLEIEGVEIRSISQAIEDIMIQVLKVEVPNGEVITNSLLYLTIYSACELVLRLALLIVLFILNLTVFKFIYWVIYMFVKPRPKDEFGLRIKQTKMSRVYGGLVGIFNFILIMLIFCVPLSAVFSLAEDAVEIVEITENKTNDKIVLSFDGNKVNLNSNSKGLLESLGIDTETAEMITEYSQIYRNTIPGFIYSFPIGDRKLDTAIFDSLFKVEYKDQKLQLRREIETALEIAQEIARIVDLNEALGEDSNFLVILDNLTEEQINTIFGKLNELELIEFAIPLAADTFEILVQYGDETVTAYVDFLDAIKVIKDGNYENLIEQVGKSVGSAKALLDEVGLKISDITSGEFDYSKLLSAKPESIQNVLDNIAGIELLDKALHAVENNIGKFMEENESFSSFLVSLPTVEIIDDKYVLNSNVTNVTVFTEELEQLDFKVSDDKKWIIVYEGEEYSTDVDASDSMHKINLSGFSLSNEIKQIGVIYEKFNALGIENINQLTSAFGAETEEEVKEIDYSKWTYEKLLDLAKAITDLQVVKIANENVLVYVNNILPIEYRNKINVFNKLTPEDLTVGLIVVRAIAKEGVLTLEEGEELDYQMLFENHTEDLIKAFEGSELIVNSLTDILSVLLNSLFETAFEGEKVIVIGDDIDWHEELPNLLTGVKELLINIDFNAEKLDLSNVNTEKVADALSKSKVLTSNLNSILGWLVKQIDMEGFTLEIPEDTVWDYDQINSLLSAVKIVFTMYLNATNEDNEFDVNVFINELCSLSDEDIDIILSNDLIAKTFISLLYDMANSEDGMLKDVIIINIAKDDYDTWLGKDGNPGELSAILHSIKLIIKDVDFNDEDSMINVVMDNLTMLTNNIELDGEDDQVGMVLSSIILVDTLEYYLKDLSEGEDAILVYPEGIELRDNGNVPGELRKVITALKLLLEKVEINFEDNDVDKLVDGILKLTGEDINVLLNSDILYATVDKYLVDLDKEGQIKYNSELDLKVEFAILIENLPLVFGEDFSFSDFEELDVNELINNIMELTDGELDELLSSEILCDTIVMYIEGINSEDEEILVINDDVVWKSNGEDKGELYNIIKALQCINGKTELDFNNLELDSLVDAITEFNDDEVETVFSSSIIYATVDKYLVELDGDGAIKYNSGLDLKAEFVILIENLPLVFGEDFSFSDFEEIDVNEVINNIMELSDNELENLLDSEILSDTIVMYIEDINSEDEEILVINDDVVWKSTDTEHGELYNIIKALQCINSKTELDFNNLELDSLVDAIAEFNDDEVETVFSSSVIHATVDKYLVEMDADGTIVYKDVEDLKYEFKYLLKSSTLVFGEEFKFSELSDINTNEVLYNISHLENDINGSSEEDEVGVLLNSKILSDTIVMYIEDYSNEDDSPIVMPDGDIEWYDYNVGSTKEPGELRSMIGALGVLFADEEEIDLNSIDANIIKGLDDNDVDTMLESVIIYGTIKDILEGLDGELVVNEITDLNTELKALIKAIDIVFEEDEDLNNPEFDVNVILKITDGEMDQILDSMIIFDTFYGKLHELTEGDLEGILVFKPGMDEDKEELINFVGSIKVVLGDQDLTDMDESSFDIDVFINLSNEEIDKLLESVLVKYSAALQVDIVLYGDEAPLNDYVELSNNETMRIYEIEHDLADLLRVIRDLDNKGINYNEFSFEAFENAINDGDDPDSNALELSNILTQSQIITQSLNKMMRNILSESISEEDMESVRTDLSDDEWKGTGSDEGELTRLLKLIILLEQFTGEEANNSSIDDPEELSTPLKQINHSLVLHGLIPSFMRTATENLDEWMSGDEPETVDEWDQEIDVLSALIAKVYSMNLNLGELELTGDNAVDVNELGFILHKVNESIMLDINNIVIPLEVGISSTFGVEIELDTSSLDSEDAWDVEIDNIVNAVHKLQNVTDTDITSKEIVPEKYGSTNKGYQNATEVGMFLDECCKSVILEQVVDAVIDSVVPSGYGTYVDIFLAQFGGSYTLTLQKISSLIQQFS